MSDDGADEVLQPLRELECLLATVVQLDERLYTLASSLVRDADDGDLADGALPADRLLDLAGADAMPGGDDEVVLASDVEEIAALVACREVAGRVPAVDEALRSGLRSS